LPGSASPPRPASDEQTPPSSRWKASSVAPGRRRSGTEIHALPPAAGGAWWCAQVSSALLHHHGVKLACSRPDTPTDNPFSEPCERTRSAGRPRPAVVPFRGRGQTPSREMEEEERQHDSAPHGARQPGAATLRLPGTKNKQTEK